MVNTKCVFFKIIFVVIKYVKINRKNLVKEKIPMEELAFGWLIHVWDTLIAKKFQGKNNAIYQKLRKGIQ